MVHRRPRPTLKAFIKMLMTYGRGRAEQFRLHPTPGSALNFVPPLFVVYFVFVHVLMFTGPDWLAVFAYLPILLYWLVLLVEVLKALPRHGIVRSLCSFPLLFLTHVFYGLGFWRGLFTRVDKSKPATTEVLIERLSPES